MFTIKAYNGLIFSVFFCEWYKGLKFVDWLFENQTKSTQIIKCGLYIKVSVPPWICGRLRGINQGLLKIFLFSKFSFFWVFGGYTFSDHSGNLCELQRKETRNVLKTLFLRDGCQVALDFLFLRKALKLGWLWWNDTESSMWSYSYRSFPVPLCSPPNPRGLTRDWTIAFAVRGSRIAVWNVTPLRPRVSRLII